MKTKTIDVTYSVSYKLKGKLLEEYLEWLDDDRDNKKNREWFVIDRFIGHHNLALFDPKAKLKVAETEEDN